MKRREDLARNGELEFEVEKMEEILMLEEESEGDFKGSLDGNSLDTNKSKTMKSHVFQCKCQILFEMQLRLKADQNI